MRGICAFILTSAVAACVEQPPPPPSTGNEAVLVWWDAQDAAWEAQDRAWDGTTNGVKGVSAPCMLDGVARVTGGRMAGGLSDLSFAISFDGCVGQLATVDGDVTSSFKQNSTVLSVMSISGSVVVHDHGLEASCDLDQHTVIEKVDGGDQITNLGTICGYDVATLGQDGFVAH